MSETVWKEQAIQLMALLDQEKRKAAELIEAMREIAGNGDGTGRNPQLMVNAALAAIARAEGRS